MWSRRGKANRTRRIVSLWDRRIVGPPERRVVAALKRRVVASVGRWVITSSGRRVVSSSGHGHRSELMLEPGAWPELLEAQRAERSKKSDGNC
jgi:hypothetical protein